MPRRTSDVKPKGVRREVEREQDTKTKKRWVDLTQAERAAIVRSLRRPTT